jgi:hypothetical protein
MKNEDICTHTAAMTTTACVLLLQLVVITTACVLLLLLQYVWLERYKYVIQNSPVKIYIVPT